MDRDAVISQRCDLGCRKVATVEVSRRDSPVSACIVEETPRRFVLTTIGRLDCSPQDESVRNHDVALVTLDCLRLALASVTHLRVADRNDAVLRDPVANSIAAAIPIFPVVLPLLPADQVAPYMAKLGIAPGKTETAQQGPLPQNFGDQFGWPETAAAVARVYNTLPPEERTHTAIYTGSYGDAGSLEHYGPALNLPRVLSAHNTYWYWGQGATAQTLILVNSDRLIREGHCTSVTEGPEVGHPLSMAEDRFRIRVCHGLKKPLPELWPTLKHWS